jgi:hypothetical protein
MGTFFLVAIARRHDTVVTVELRHDPVATRHDIVGERTVAPIASDPSALACAEVGGTSLARSGSMRRLAVLLLAASLATGCISGIDKKPYEITLGPELPTIDPEGNPGLLFLGMLAVVAAASACIATEHCKP